MAKKSKTVFKQQTVAEFKAWLTGIMEFQPKDWCPNAAQWKAIQDRINNLKEEVIVKQQIPTQYPVIIDGAQQQRPVYGPAPNVPNAPQVASFGSGRQMQMLPEEDGVTPPDIIVIPDETTVAPSGQAPSVETVSSRVLASGGKKFRTPSDLSGKPYTSGFK